MSGDGTLATRVDVDRTTLWLVEEAQRHDHRLSTPC